MFTVTGAYVIMDITMRIPENARNATATKEALVETFVTQIRADVYVIKMWRVIDVTDASRTTETSPSATSVQMVTLITEEAAKHARVIAEVLLYY